jgi:hypothetical protein
MTEAEEIELKELRAFKAKVEPVIQNILDILYWDPDRGCYDPDYEWSQDEIEYVDAEILKLYRKPKLGTTAYPKLKLGRRCR